MPPRAALIGVALLILTPLAHAQRHLVIEAEDCQIVSAHGRVEQNNMWAHGGRRTPAFWGQAVGDSVTFTQGFSGSTEPVHLGVRFAFNRQSSVDYTHTENPARVLDLMIDGNRVADVPVPDTGSWDLFRLSSVSLPPLSEGSHTIALVASQPNTYTDVDCFVLFRGEESALPPALRSTVLFDTPSGHFTLRATGGVTVDFRPDATMEEFERIYSHFREHFGWEPPLPIGVYIIEDARWTDPGASSYQNQCGVFFPEHSFLGDHGNWVHEMTHMFYCAHFPWWFDESSARCLTTFNWAPELFPAFARPEDNPHYRQCAAEGQRVLDDPSFRSDACEPIQYAIRLRYGRDVFSRFFHLCLQAGERGEIDFTPGRHLTKDEIVRYMSQAAGEDVRPLYERWNGFAGAE